jgi:hypothetical protein
MKFTRAWLESAESVPRTPFACPLEGEAGSRKANREGGKTAWSAEERP